MITAKKDNDSTDKWFEQQLDAIRQLKPDHTPDVTDAVMRRIADMPKIVALPQRRKGLTLKITSGIAAACLIGIVVTTALSGGESVQAATTNHEMANRFYDIYSYCNDYADEEEAETAAYYDNPITNFI